MKVGNIVKWSWYLNSSDWERTHLQGLIVAARVAKTDYEKVLIWNVLLTDGSLCEVREDEDGLECVA